MQEASHHRLTFISAMFAGLILALAAQLVRWQVIAHFKPKKQPEDTRHIVEMIAPQRGLIKDCDGYLLASNTFRYKIIAHPDLIKNPQEVADQLWAPLGLSRQQLIRTLTEERFYALLQWDVPPDIGETILNWERLDIQARPEAKRLYPGKTLAAHVLGFVKANGDGCHGLEGRYDEILSGKVGRREGQKGEWGQLLPIGLGEFIPPQDGCDLILTVDRDVQFVVEQELGRGVEEHKAEGGTVIVMEPKTGAILAMASYPAYDPNDFAFASPELFINPAISKSYEPGSVFKIITVASGIEAGVVSPATIFYDEGSIEIGGFKIRNWDDKAHGQVTLTDVLAYSLNVESVKIGQALGTNDFYNYVQRFGFGQPTEVDLDSEVTGKLKLPGDGQWHESDLGTNSFGQGIAVTPMQMVTAIAAVANDGLLMKPHVVGNIIEGEKVTLVQPVAIRQAISAATARKVTSMLVEALKEEAPAAQVEGYSVAGKTGTAQIPGYGVYEEGATIASFIGYAPAEDPAFVMLVKIDKPQVSPWGSEVAAPIFKRIAEQLFLLLGVPPDGVRLVHTGG